MTIWIKANRSGKLNSAGGSFPEIKQVVRSVHGPFGTSLLLDVLCFGIIIFYVIFVCEDGTGVD